MKKIAILFILFVSSGFLNSCWAPRCPMKTCKVIHEHRHHDFVKGVFSPRHRLPQRIHYIWDKNKGENNPNTDLEKSGRKKIKGKKKFPWERW